MDIGMKFSFILMRHAEAHHNTEKEKLKSKLNGVEKLKQSPAYFPLRIREELIDSSITQNGIFEAKKSARLLENSEIGLVLVSPLMRCLETCNMLIKGLHTIPQVIVDPLLADRLSSSWSIYSELSDTMKKFPKFLLEESQKCDQKSSDCSKQNKNPALEFLTEGKFETYAEFHSRVERFRNKLIHYQTKTDKKILILSHSSFLKFLTGSGTYNEDKKNIKGCKFTHCNPVYFTEKAVLNRAEIFGQSKSPQKKDKLPVGSGM